jgi:H+/Cl- antiporter ClcA
MNSQLLTAFLFQKKSQVCIGKASFEFCLFCVCSEPMSAKNPTGIFIPSVFVGEEAGSILNESYQYNTGSFILINDEQPFNISTHLLIPFAIVVGICSLIMVVFMVCLQSFRIYIF